MRNRILRIQTDYTYEVMYNGVEYIVVQIEDLPNGYLQWDVFDDVGQDLEETDDDLRRTIIAFVLQNT